MWTINREYLVQYIVILIIAFILFYFAWTSQYYERNGQIGDEWKEGNGPIHADGRGSKKDSTAVLLDRLTWLSYSDNRISWWQRLITPTLVAVALICLASKELPSPTMIVIMLITIYISFMAFRSYYQVHGDLYIDYYIRNNADLIRQKMGLEEHLAPPTKSKEVPARVLLL